MSLTTTQSFVPAMNDDSFQTMGVLIPSNMNHEVLRDAFFDAGIPKSAIAYENTDGENVQGFFVRGDYGETAYQVCKKYNTMPFFCDIDFDEARRVGLINFLEHKREEIKKTNPDLFSEYDRLSRFIEKNNQSQIKKSISINFICNQKVNYIRDEAPVADNLISIIQNGNIETFIRQGIVGQVVGAGGIGKTHFLTQLALSVAAGIPFLGEQYSTGIGGHVFVALGENSDDDIHRLLKKLSINITDKDKIAQRLAVMSLCGKDASFVNKNGDITAFYNALFKELKRTEPEKGWKLIIIDPVSRVLGAQAENDNAAATAFISLLERFTLELKGNPTVLFGHHMSKQGIGNISNTDQTAARGSSAITDGVRWQANLERVEKNESKNEYEKDQVRLRIVKSNHTELYDPIILRKVEGGRLELYKDNQHEEATRSKRKPSASSYQGETTDTSNQIPILRRQDLK